MSTGRQTRLIMMDVCVAVIARRDELSRYDAAIGDGDHGASMAKAFRRVHAELEPLGEATPKAILATTGAALLSAVGGAMGPLLGTAFLEAAEAVPDDGTLSASVIADMLTLADAGVTRLGGASLGDKTMIDALRPAAIAATEAADSGATARSTLLAAARAARRGADLTVTMQARRGRASRLGERSIGHPDPGAMSTALILETAAESAGAGDARMAGDAVASGSGS